jgi:tetratricopeptide (TPR) repeat protein
MADNKEPQDGEAEFQFEIPPEFKQSAKEFFKRGQDAMFGLNYDYAIELILDGLSFWPTATEEGHKPLREVAVRRAATGKKKAGMRDGNKYRKGGKNAKDKMLKAEYLWSKDPDNLGHCGDFVDACIEAGYSEPGVWAVELMMDISRRAKKVDWKTWCAIRDWCNKLEQYKSGLFAVQQALSQRPKDESILESLKECTILATMERGNYQDGGDFRDSIKDRDAQSDAQNEQRLAQSEETQKAIVTRAKEEYEEAPTVDGKINAYVNALCSTENAKMEQVAINLLEKKFVETEKFNFKQTIGEIQQRHFNRKLRKIKLQLDGSPNHPELMKRRQTLMVTLLKIELEHYKNCVENYPTELSMKNEYGKRLLQAKRYDDAIPMFQDARNDPKYRINAYKHIGECFFYKKWFDDAIDQFKSSLDGLSNEDSDDGKELLYLLGRANEANKKTDEALKFYRKVVQMDFNYRDVRKRIDDIRNRQ